MKKKELLFGDQDRCGKPSASGMERLILCPASWQEEQKYPPAEDTADSAMGTRLHKHMEDGTTPDNPEEAEALAWCREKEQYLLEHFPYKDDETYFTERREVRLWDKDGKFSGKADVFYLAAHATHGYYVGNESPYAALIIDYKFGRGDVTPAQDNAQLGTLALLLKQRHPGLQHLCVALLQPFGTRDIVLAEYDEPALRDFHVRLSLCLVAATQENPLHRPSEKACKYCRASASCPALKTQLQKAQESGLTQNWDTLTPQQKRDAWNMTRLATRWVKAVEYRIRRDLEKGADIPGLTIGNGKTSFSVTDPTAAYTALNGIISASEFASCCKVQISTLDKLLHARLKQDNPRLTLEQARAWVRDALANCGETKTSAGTIKAIVNTKTAKA